MRTDIRKSLAPGPQSEWAVAQLLAWGWNARGTLGHGHRATERKPRYVSELRGVRIVQAAIGGWHCLAVDELGQVAPPPPPPRSSHGILCMSLPGRRRGCAMLCSSSRI